MFKISQTCFAARPHVKINSSHYSESSQSVQELFFFVIGAFVELFTVLILFKFFGCDVQQERNCT